MKLGEILQGGGAHPVSPRRVAFQVIGHDEQMRLLKARAEAVLVFVDEHKRNGCRVKAREAVHKRFPNQDVPPGVLVDEEEYQLLFEALREASPDDKGRYPHFASTVEELRSSLMLRECQRLRAQYDQYCAEEFPPVISKEDMAKLVEEAKKNSLSDLLTSYGYERSIAALSTLAGRSTA
jgi:hypothetical protein